MRYYPAVFLSIRPRTKPASISLKSFSCIWHEYRVYTQPEPVHLARRLTARAVPFGGGCPKDAKGGGLGTMAEGDDCR
jgi:hypothetical protein